MKKIFILFILIVPISTVCQNIEWKLPQPIKVSLTENFSTVSGRILGEIGDYQYGIVVQEDFNLRKKRTYEFSILKIKNNAVESSSSFSRKKYEIISIEIFKEKIGVIYITSSNRVSQSIKIDYYDPLTFKFVSSEELYSFPTPKNIQGLKQIVFSKDKSKMVILTYAHDPKKGEDYNLFKVLDNQLNIITEYRLKVDFSKFRLTGRLCVFNDNSVLQSYTVVTNSVIEQNEFYRFSENGEDLIIYEGELKMNGMDNLYVDLGSNQYSVFLVERNKLCIFNLNFNTLEATETFNIGFFSGSWKMDMIMTLENGNYVVAVANRLKNRIKTKDTQYYIHNCQSIEILCFNPTCDDFIYQTRIFRRYYVYEGNPSPYGYITLSPFYFTQNNMVHVLYNTDPRYVDNGQPDLNLYTKNSSPNANLELVTIDDIGEIKKQIIANSVNEKMNFATSFFYEDKNGKINLAKFKLKKIAFGTINLN